MPTYLINNPELGLIFMRGDLGPHCTHCMAPAEILCDYVVGKRTKSCSLPLCPEHAHQVGPDLHCCPGHAKLYQEHTATAGLQPFLFIPVDRLALSSGMDAQGPGQPNPKN